MKKSAAFLALFIFWVASCASFSFCQEADLVGTWTGSTFIPEVGENEVTLVLSKKEGEWAATMSDSLGMLADTVCEDIKFEDDTLTFNFTISQEMQSQTIWITLEVEGNSMKGYWENDQGEQGDIELTKQ